MTDTDPDGPSGYGSQRDYILQGKKLHKQLQGNISQCLILCIIKVIMYVSVSNQML